MIQRDFRPQTARQHNKRDTPSAYDVSLFHLIKWSVPASLTTEYSLSGNGSLFHDSESIATASLDLLDAGASSFQGSECAADGLGSGTELQLGSNHSAQVSTLVYDLRPC